MYKKVFFTVYIFLFIFHGLFAFNTDRMPTRRFGIFIGANNGGRERTVLRYAVTDARSVSQVFTTMGGIADEDNFILVEPTVREINRHLDSIERMVLQSRAHSQRTELVFYYSGHSDDEGIFLNRERYSYSELRNRINSINADMRIIILDSCSSGAMTRAKGGEKVQPFLFDSSISAEGFAILTSSSENEVSQESDIIESSYFTNSILAGLRGAADSVGDGRVTLTELYRFAYSETRARTETTLFGPQNPSFDIQISGTGDVVLTDIKEISATLNITEEITGRLSIRDSSEFLVAELTKVTSRPILLGLESGIYTITLQQNNNFFRSVISLSENRQIDLRMSNFQIIAASVGGRARGDSENEDTAVITLKLQLIPGINVLGDNGSTSNVLFGFFLAFAHNTEKAAISSLATVNTGYVNGYQGSLIFNYASELNGLQLSLFNLNNSGKGVMIGAVNISQSEDMIPIGIVNFVKGGIFHPAIYIDDMLFTNISLRSGGKHFYTLINFGLKFDSFPDNENLLVSRFGFGYELPVNKMFFNLDLSLGSVFSPRKTLEYDADDDEWEDEWNVFGAFNGQTRFTFGYKIFKHLGVFGGISYDLFISKGNANHDVVKTSVSNIPALAGYQNANNHRLTHKFGFFAGIQF